MKLKQHRLDINFLESLFPSCYLPKHEIEAKIKACAKRYQHMISWAEAVLDETESARVDTMEKRERRVVKDAGK